MLTLKTKENCQNWDPNPNITIRKKRIVSHKKGYLRGSPDLIINNLHEYYTGFAIEFKNPEGDGVLSYDESKMLRQYENNGFKTLVSNDCDHVIEQFIEYFRDVRIKCSYCPRKFVSSWSIKNHIKSFHKMRQSLKNFSVYIVFQELHRNW